MKLKEERGTDSGLLTLWREDVPPCSLCLFEVKLGTRMIVRATMTGGEAETAFKAAFYAIEAVNGKVAA